METDREEVLARIQRRFEYQVMAYGKLNEKEKDIPVMDCNAKQAWKRIQKLIVDEKDKDDYKIRMDMRGPTIVCSAT